MFKLLNCHCDGNINGHQTFWSQGIECVNIINKGLESGKLHFLNILYYISSVNHVHVNNY